MNSTSRQKIKPKARPDLLEWQIVEDESQWQASQEATPLASAAHTPRTLRRYWLLLAALVLLVGMSGAAWILARKGLATIEADVHSAVEVDAWLTDPSAAGHPLVQGAEIVELGQNWARVRVLVQGPKTQEPEQGVVYRQTRIYQESGAGWLRVAPTAGHWGRAQQVESAYFIIRYFAQDEEAVLAVAPKLDALYPTFYAALLPGTPPSTKLVMVIDPAHSSELDISKLDIYKQAGAPDAPITLPSPSATLAPVAVTEEALLLQGAAFALFERMAAQSDALHALPEQWRAFRMALRLWLLWDQELPLASWRQPLVRWVFWADAGGETLTTSSALVPAFAHQLCTDHRLWMNSEAELELPVVCFPRADGEEAILAFRYPSAPPVRLPDFVGESQESPSPQIIRSVTEQPPPPAASIAFATLLEYVSATYGSETMGPHKSDPQKSDPQKSDAAPVRALIAAIPNHESWETLIPALYGVSTREFEAGWNAFLTEHYGIASPKPPL